MLENTASEVVDPQPRSDKQCGRVARVVSALPLTTTLLIAALVVVSLIRSTGDLATDEPYDIRTLMLSLLTADDAFDLSTSVLLLLVVGLCAERVMGARRLILAFVGGGLITSVLGLAVGEVEVTLFSAIPLNLQPDSGAPPSAALIVVAATASGFMGPLWRRRVRLGSTFLSLTLFLYSASANDLYAIIALPVGLGLGVLLGGKRKGRRVWRSSHHETRVLLAALSAVTAIGPVVATLWGTGAGLLSVYGWLSFDPLIAVDGVVCAAGSSFAPCPEAGDFSELQPNAGWIAVLPLMVLLVASWGILRGRRGALSIAVTMNILIFIGMAYLFVVTEPATLAQLAEVRAADTAYVWQTIVGLAVGAVVPLAVAITLLLFRRAVAVESAHGARTLLVRTVGIAACSTLAAALALSILSAKEFTPVPNPGAVLAALPLRLLPPSLLAAEALRFVPNTPTAQAIWYMPSTVFWTVCVIAAVRFVLSRQAVQGAADQDHVRRILVGGGGSLSFMATWTRNYYWFAPEAEAAFAYRIQGRIAVTLGGAFGRDRHHPEVGRAFVDFCGKHGWTPVFYSVDDDARVALSNLGWQDMRIAQEARVDPQTWTPAGKKRQDIRTATNRAQREGTSSEWVAWSELTLRDRSRIFEISEGWVADKTIPEMDFMLGGVDELKDPAVRLMLARDARGHITAVTSWLPVYHRGQVKGYTLDFMRRSDSAMNGVMEFLIGAVVERTRADGCTLLSLSGSPLASHHGTPSSAEPFDRALKTLSALLEPAYGFRSLANFKKKFQPTFAPLWMVYSDAAQLPAVGFALLRCYVPNLTVARAARLSIPTRADARSQ